MKIGLGIITYNRLDTLKQCFQSVLDTDYKLLKSVVIADDSSTDGTHDWLRKNRNLLYPVIGDKNVGIARNSNRALQALRKFDFGFLINDDIYFKKPGWVSTYLKAMVESPYKHFCFMGGSNGIGYSHSEYFNGIEVTHHSLSMGSFLTFNKEILKQVGGFDSRFGIYGLEHTDWSERIGFAGLSRKFDVHGYYDSCKVVDVSNSLDYIGDIEVNSVFNDSQKLDFLTEARSLSNEVRANLYRSGFSDIYRPFITGRNP